MTNKIISKVVCNLCGNRDNIEKYARDLLDRILACDDLQSLFIELSEDEKAAKEALAETVKKYPTVMKQDNINDVIAVTLKKKQQREERYVYGGEAVLAAISSIIESHIHFELVTNNKCYKFKYKKVPRLILTLRHSKSPRKESDSEGLGILYY